MPRRNSRRFFLPKKIHISSHHLTLDTDGVVNDASRDDLVVIIEGKDASIVLDKDNGASSSN